MDLRCSFSFQYYRYIWIAGFYVASNLLDAKDHPSVSFDRKLTWLVQASISSHQGRHAFLLVIYSLVARPTRGISSHFHFVLRYWLGDRRIQSKKSNRTPWYWGKTRSGSSPTSLTSSLRWDTENDRCLEAEKFSFTRQSRALMIGRIVLCSGYLFLWQINCLPTSKI